MFFYFLYFTGNFAYYFSLRLMDERNTKKVFGPISNIVSASMKYFPKASDIVTSTTVTEGMTSTTVGEGLTTDTVTVEGMTKDIDNTAGPTTTKLSEEDDTLPLRKEIFYPVIVAANVIFILSVCAIVWCKISKSSKVEEHMEEGNGTSYYNVGAMLTKSNGPPQLISHENNFEI